MAARQDALFHAPDAFYRTERDDAIHAAPGTAKKLDDLRQDLIDRAANDYQRGRLTSALGAQMELTRDGMARHVAEQSLAWQRQVAQDRIALLTKEVALHHGDDALIDTLGHAAATAARAHARVGTGLPGGVPEDTAAATARSGVLGAAIQARLDRGDADGARALFTRIGDQLDPEHVVTLQSQIQSDAESSDVQTAQSIGPLFGKPPFYFPKPSSPPEAPRGPGVPAERGGTVPRFQPIEGRSGKEGKTDIPKWAKDSGVRPRVGEKPRDAADRFMNDQYGKGNWEEGPAGGGKNGKGKGTGQGEFSQLKKFFESHFRDPKDIPAPYDGPSGIPGSEPEANLPPDGKLQPLVA